MVARFLLIGLCAVFAGGGAADAQDAPIARGFADSAPPVGTPATVSTANPKTAQPATRVPSSGDPTADQIADWLHADSSPVQPLDPRAQPFPDPDAPRQVHGEVGFGVSNRGYEAHAAAAMPIGQASELDVAVSGAHVRTPWGNANPRSLAVGLYLDGGDVARFISRDKCHVPRYGVSLPTDPQVQADGSCVRTDRSGARSGD